MKRITYILFGLVLFISGCYTPQKAAKQSTKAYIHYPEQIADLHARWFNPIASIKTTFNFTPGKAILQEPDTVIKVIGDTVVKVITNTITKTDTITKTESKEIVNKAREEQLTFSNAKIKADYNTLSTKHKTTKWWLWRIVGLSIALIIIIIILLFNKIKWLFSFF